jgi:hypothetical protein
MTTFALSDGNNKFPDVSPDGAMRNLDENPISKEIQLAIENISNSSSID